MKTVGIRELKNSLSRVIRSVEAGERIGVTDRGRIVAYLTPADDATTERRDRYAMLIASGIIRAPHEEGSPLADWPARRSVRAPAGLASRLIDQDRGE